MDLTENDVDIISTNSEEYVQNQITNNDEDTSPKRQRVNVTENNKDTYPNLITNQEATREELSESDENNDVNDDSSFSKVQSEDTWEMNLLEEPQHAKEKEKQVKKQKLKSKQWIEILKETNAISANSSVRELLGKSKNNNEQLEIINEILEDINKLLNYTNNSKNQVTSQFNPNTIQFDKFNINPIIVNKIGEISRKLPQITLDNINNTNSYRTKADRLRNSGEIAQNPINMDVTTYLGLNNSLRTVRNSSVQHNQEVGRKRKRSRKQQVTASSSETSTSLSHIAQLETDEKILLQEIENELNKQKILLRKQRIEAMQEIVCNLKKKSAYKKVNDEQTRQTRTITALNTHRQLKNEDTFYEDNFVIKDRVGSEACRFNVKFTIEDLRPKSYKGSRAHRIIYDFVEGQLKRTISSGAASETNQQVVPQCLQEIQPSTSTGETSTERRQSARIKRSSIFSFKKKIQQKKTLISEIRRKQANTQVRGSDGRFAKTKKDTSKTVKQVKSRNVKPSNIFKSLQSKSKK
ncbi:hypothetical protein ALC57_03474 [Trachymyrmex cornetzi]|uniref:Uncharacterized protein n=2 Tax=Trachymyrmex cornetzi TaxID=471704 RepID=A0A195EG39_9HYME|nr:hypothetical protein ALC57_03474 [Trachymyrmex cornetzi]